MKKMKRFLAMLLAVTLLSSTALFTTGASAASDRETKAQVLSALGLFKGYDNTGTNFGLSNGATREHAILFLIRMLGEESAAAAWTGAQPFSDVPSGDYYYPYIGYAKAKGYTNGLGNNKFGLGQSANMKQMTAFALRGLGYSESAGDFTYQNSLVFAKSKGILESSTAPATFTRGNAVDVLFGATFSNMKSQSTTLIERLAEKGAVTEAQLDKANAILDGKTTGPKSDLANGTYTMSLMGNYIRVTSGNALELRNTTPAQTFKVTNQSSGDAYIQTSDGYYVGITKLNQGTQLVLGTTPYSWLIQKQSSGAYTIRPYEKQSMIVNASDEKSANGTKIIIWPHSGAPKNTLITMKASTAKVAVTGVKLDQTSVSVAVGKTYALTGTITPSNATNQSVTWSSSATSIAKVSTDGVVTGVKAGTATITVKTVDGSKTATCKVTVTAANTYTDKKVNLYNSTTQTVKGIYISSTQNKDWGSNLTSGTVAPNASVAILVPVSSTDYTYDIKLVYTDNSSAEFTGYNFKDFTSGGSLFAYIDKGTPMLSTTKPGAAKVAVTGVKLDQTTVTVTVGKTTALTGTISPSNATDKSVIWTTNTPSTATVDSNGVVTGLMPGIATITVKTADGAKTATCKVTVVAVANTTADSKKLFDRHAKVVKEFNAVREEVDKISALQTQFGNDLDELAKSLNTDLAFISQGSVYTQEQIDKGNAILAVVEELLPALKADIAAAKQAQTSATKSVNVTIVNNTSVNFTSLTADGGSNLLSGLNGQSNVTVTFTMPTDDCQFNLVFTSDAGATYSGTIDLSEATNGSTYSITLYGDANNIYW